MEELVKQYLKPIYGFVFYYAKNRADAEDLTQEVFLRVWKNFKKIDPEKNLKAWLFRIAKNTALDWLKKKKAVPFSNFEDAEGDNPVLDQLTDPAPLPDELFARADLAEQLNAALAKLPENQREVLTLYYLGQLNLPEIAESLKQPLNTIKSRHRRGLIALRQYLTKISDQAL